jgi:Asp-tRNA(Asn)/Glu-tRNA(Gln) amidotransferase A subunit family amidase
MPDFFAPMSQFSMNGKNPDEENLLALRLPTARTECPKYNPRMNTEATSTSDLQLLRDRLRASDADPVGVASHVLDQANGNAGRNVYLTLDRTWTLTQAAALLERFPDRTARPPLYGLPISLKDCFDLEGFPTTCGSRFYAAHNGIASSDSWVAERLRSQGAVLTGKTHLHQLAYGITGENSEYGDCAQPIHAEWLTGGSSSGAAASVQEGSAVAAIGTDTGGSIRCPAAFCGLAGYRSSIGLGDWRGAAHLAKSFDTLGWLFRDLRDAPLLANALLDVPLVAHSAERTLRIGAVDSVFLYDAEPYVLQAFETFKERLQSLGIVVEGFDSGIWKNSFDIFAPIQASEAAEVHKGYFEHFEPAIAERLAWGASISEEELRQLRDRHEKFRRGFDQLFDIYDFLILLCAPVGSLTVGADHSAARKNILRYTSPASLAGTPVVAISLNGAGVQLIGRRGADAALVAFAAYLGEKLKPQILLTLRNPRC